MLRTIATQTQLESVNFALSQLSDNLSAHANTDLSDAHGLNLIFGPTNDGHGNNLSTYTDASGNLVGSFQIVMVINGVRVYIPAQVTALAGKDPNTGQNTAEVIADQTGAGVSTWVTQFNDTLTGLVRSILETYFLPHTQDGYWEVHGGTSLITPELQHFGVAGSGTAPGWWTNGGVRVAHSSVAMNADGFILRIPCETTIGGPAKTTVLGPFAPTLRYTEIGGNAPDNPVWNFTITPVVLSGTHPFTYAYRYLDSGGNWVPFAAGINFPIPMITYIQGEGIAADFMTVNYSASTGVMTFLNGAPFNENSAKGAVVRVIVTGGDGNPVEIATDGHFAQFTFEVYRNDDDS